MSTPLVLSDLRLCQTCQQRRPGDQGHWLVSDDRMHRRWECDACADSKARREVRRMQQAATGG